MANRIRPIAIAVIQRDNDILVFEGYDPTHNQTFYRPLGGGIEFGEFSRDTLIREIREELGAELTALCYLGTLESIFLHTPIPGHEIVQVYRAEFVDAALYHQPELVGREDDGTIFRALWRSLAEFAAGRWPLYPIGLLELLGHPAG